MSNFGLCILAGVIDEAGVEWNRVFSNLKKPSGILKSSRSEAMKTKKLNKSLNHKKGRNCPFPFESKG
jgi:hypothetical protein